MGDSSVKLARELGGNDKEFVLALITLTAKLSADIQTRIFHNKEEK